MELIALLEANRVVLSRHVDLLQRLLESGNLQKVLFATKQFISKLSEYLSLQEVALSRNLDITGLKTVKRENRVIKDHLDDIYAIHVTEPDGEFMQVMTRVIEAVEEKLMQDSKLINVLSRRDPVDEFAPVLDAELVA